MGDEMKNLNQLILKFDFDQNFKAQDVYVSKSNKYSFKLAQVGCENSKESCCMSNQSPQGHLVNGISYLNSYKFTL